MSAGIEDLTVGQSAILDQWAQTLTASDGRKFSAVINDIAGYPMGDKERRPNFQPSDSAEIDIAIGELNPMPAATESFLDVSGKLYRSHRMKRYPLAYRYYCGVSQKVSGDA